MEELEFSIMDVHEGDTDYMSFSLQVNMESNLLLSGWTLSGW